MLSGMRRKSLESYKQIFEETQGTLTATTSLDGVTSEVLDEIAMAYFNRYKYNLITPNEDRCLSILPNNLKLGNPVIFLKKNGLFVGALVCSPLQIEISNDIILNQTFFNTTLEGHAAARAVIVSHRVMVAYAKSMKFQYAMSIGSNKDPKHNFNKLLEIDGWLTESHMSVWRINKGV